MRTTAVAVRGLVLLQLAGCLGDLRLAGDQDGAPADVADASIVEDRAAPDDVGMPDDAPGDEALPAGPNGCPAVLAGEGAVVPAVRWIRRVEGVWRDSGSAGLAEAQGVVVVGLPTGSSTGEGIPRAFRFFDAATGEPLDDPTSGEHADWFAWCWAVAGVRVGSFVHFVGLRWAGGVPEAEGATFDPRDGAEHGGGWLMSSLGVRLRNVRDLRATAAASAPGEAFQSFDVVRGSAPGGAPVAFAWLEGESDLAGWQLADGATGEPSRTWAAPGGWLTYEIRGDLEVAVSTPTALVLRELAGRTVATAALRAPSAWTPLLAAHPERDRSDFLLAGRSDDVSAGAGMWTELHAARDLSLLASSDLSALDAQVVRPEPRELAGGGERFVLVWATPERADSAPGDGCLYVTPLDAAGVPSGAAIRVDEAATGDAAPIEFVRTTADGNAAFLLWRRGTDLWVARVDS